VAQHSRRTLLDRFDDMVFESRETSCHIWLGACDLHDYGLFNTRRGRRPMKAHRFIWEVSHGAEIPPGLVVRHTCDHPYCVNPDHLVVGTQAQNLQDARDRGRWAIRNPARPQGSKNPSARLTEATVTAIRVRYAAGISKAQIAREYGLLHSHVWSIVNRRIWKHIP
jgi:hypothetical protein